MYATPSFVGGVITQPTVNQPNSQAQASDPSENITLPEIKVKLVSLVDGSCSLTVTFSVTSTNPIDQAIIRYTGDPNEASSGDFCMWGSGTDLQSISSTTYQASFELPGTVYPFNQIQNGAVIYLMAKFRDNQGRVQCSQLITHTITTACTGN